VILLIGNGPSGDTPAVAAAMLRGERTSDFRVLRMNNWQPGFWTGDRCDIWGTSFNVDIIVRPAPEVWWTAWPYGPRSAIKYSDCLKNQKNRYDRVASKWTVARAFEGTDKWASNGIILALMAAETGEAIALAGFDHFQPGAWHHYWKQEEEWDTLEYHDPEHERRIVAKLGAKIINAG
jgi:hypothetical protein